MTVQATISIEELNRCIRLFGASQKAFMRSEKRAGLRSVLFDVPRRSSVGWYCVYRKGAQLLRRLGEHISPEEVGTRMKRLCSRPYYLTLSIVMCSYLNARQQSMLDQGLSSGDHFPDENVDDLTCVVDFWLRACRAYRNDGLLLPEQAGDTQLILAQDVVSDLDRCLVPSGKCITHNMRRMAATLELYCFILHGEQRDGIFGHGPYPVADGRQLVILEFTDLQNDFLPWAQTSVRNPYPNLALVMRLKGAKARFHVFGSMLLDPPDFAPHLEAVGLFTRTEDGAVQPVSFDETAHIQQCAADAQNELYVRAAEWSLRFQAEYGVHLFANHLRSFFHLAGLRGKFDEEIRSEFQAAASEVLDAILAQSAPPSMWNFMATTEGEFFWPVVTTEKVLAPNVPTKS